MGEASSYSWAPEDGEKQEIEVNVYRASNFSCAI